MKLTALIGEWRRRNSARRELASLDARFLKDAGITPSQAAWEAGRPFWQPLSNDRR